MVQSGGIGVTWSQLGGALLALGAAGAWAWYGLVIGPLVGALGTVRATGWTMVVAALCCTPLVLIETRDYAWRSVSWEAWAGLVYGATLGMVMAMALWGRSIHRLGPKQTMIYLYLEPVSASHHRRRRARRGAVSTAGGGGAVDIPWGCSSVLALAVVVYLSSPLRLLGAASVRRCATLDAHVLSRLQTESG